jgi:hypothetical protein
MNAGGSGFQVTLRNVSEQSIQTISLTTDTLTVDHDEDYLSPGLAPGASITIEIPVVVHRNPKGEVVSGLHGRELTVNAVVFVDRRWDGDGVDAARLLAVRDGKRVHLQRIVSTFDAAAPQINEDPQRALDKLISDISSLKAPRVRQTSLGYSQGAGNMRNEVKAFLQKLRDRETGLTQDQLRAELASIIDRYKRILEVL